LTVDHSPWAPGGWSRDSKVFAASLRRDGNVDVYLVAAEGQVLERVSSEPGEETGPSLSPDGTMVMYQVNDSGQNHLYVVKREASAWSAPARVTADPANSGRWSPMSNVFAYIANGEIRVQTLSGPSRTLDRIASPGRFTNLEWSPDGRMIYYKRFDAVGRGTFWVVSAEGGRPRLMVVSENAMQSPTFYPFATDGKNLFFGTSNSRADVWLAQLVTR
jgi:TolB protein